MSKTPHGIVIGGTQHIKRLVALKKFVNFSKKDTQYMNSCVIV
jgi:hypothetical protein